jgi:hypothetical protein
MPIVLDGGGTSTGPGSPTDFAFDSIYPYILPAAKSASYVLVDRAIVSAADQVLRRTRMWNLALDPVTPVVDQTDYNLPLPTGAQGVKLLDWAVAGDRKRSLTLDEAVRMNLEPGDTCGPVAYLFYENVVRVLPAPTDVTQTMTFWMQCTVMEGATSLPGQLKPYIRLLSYGALAYLQGLPQKDYTDLTQAGLNLNRFNDGVSTLSLRTTRAFGAGTIRRTPRSY